MSRLPFFGKSSFMALLAVAVCASLAYGRAGGGGHGGGGGHAGGGHASGGYHSGGGHAGGGYHGAGAAHSTGAGAFHGAQAFHGAGTPHGANAFHGAGGGMHAGSFASIAPSHAWSGGQFAYNGNFAGRNNFAAGRNNFAGRYGNDLTGRFGNNLAGRYGNTWAGRYGNTWPGRYGNWAGHHDWDHYFTHGGWGWGGWGGGYWPWYSGWGLGWGYPYGYGYSPYSYPYGSDYSYAPSYYGGYYSYPSLDNGADYSYSYAPSVYGDAGAAVDSVVTAPQQPLTSESIAPTVSEQGGQQAAPDALQYYSQAREAFVQGDYRSALRLAGHAGVDEPQNPKVHELLSLALFALRDYGPAAGEAHAAMALGAIADWKDLSSYYYDTEKYTAQLGALKVEKYTAQLRALEKAAAENPKSAAEHFLLGYHYLMIGARDNAQTQLAEAVKLTPGDKLAGHYLQELQSNSPLTPPEMASRPQGQAL